LRICSALVLVPLALATAYFGGWSFAVFWGAAGIVAFLEWASLVAASAGHAIRTLGCVSLAGAVGLCAVGEYWAGVAALAVAAILVAALAPIHRRLWLASGVPYCGAIAVAPTILRSDPDYGFVAIIFLFVVVWGTDTVGYFAGRGIGGPKLAAAVSPNKTWAGALGGTAAAMLGGLFVSRAASLSGTLALVVVAGLLSVFAQAGDVVESALKRRFGAKDSGRLIPGHGGLLDRLDGFVAAGLLAALIGLARGGFQAPGRGLLVW
jgi:phosphatidate cytidylyltransferase